MIRFTNVSMTYPGGNEALRNINLHIAQGAMVYVTGRSGAGKTTLLRLIALIDRHSRGQILVNGQNLERVRERRVPLFGGISVLCFRIIACYMTAPYLITWPYL